MEDRSHQILDIAIFFFVLSWLAVCLRVYVRTVIITAFGKDDIAMVITLLFFTAYMVCQFGGVAHGTGKKRHLITDDNAQIALRYWFFCEIFYTCATTWLKISVGLFLMRITVNITHIWIIRLIMLGSALFGIAYCFIVFFQCHPISYWWDLSPDAQGRCLSPNLEVCTLYVISVLNSVADWVFGILPIFIVKDLQMKRSVKCIVASILAFAAIGSAATIIRMPYLKSMKGYKGEFLWKTSDVAIWTTVEVGVGITAGCVAALKPLLKTFLSIIGVQSSAAQETDQPTFGWSEAKRKAATKQGYTRHGQPLDNLRPANENGHTTTIVTGRGPGNLNKGGPNKGLASWAERSRRDSEERIITGDSPPGMDFLDVKGWTGGINKSVEVTTTEERHSNSTRSGGSETNAHDDTDEERTLPGKPPAVVYERF